MWGCSGSDLLWRANRHESFLCEMESVSWQIGAVNAFILNNKIFNNSNDDDLYGFWLSQHRLHFQHHSRSIENWPERSASRGFNEAKLGWLKKEVCCCRSKSADICGFLRKFSNELGILIILLTVRSHETGSVSPVFCEGMVSWTADLSNKTEEWVQRTSGKNWCCNVLHHHSDQDELITIPTYQHKNLLFFVQICGKSLFVKQLHHASPCFKQRSVPSSEASTFGWHRFLGDVHLGFLAYQSSFNGLEICGSFNDLWIILNHSVQITRKPWPTWHVQIHIYMCTSYIIHSYIRW